MQDSTSIATKKRTPPKRAQLFELVPLALFFASYQLYGLITATAVLMVASSISLAIAWLKLRYISAPLLLGTGMVLVFGALTLVFDDEIFIKIRPTIVNLLFAAALFIGVYGFKRGLLGSIFHTAFSLTQEGWLILSKRFGFFFLFLAVMNELVWRTQETNVWVNYKLFGGMAFMMLFMISQLKLLERHKAAD